MHVKPRINPVLQMTEPTPLPKANPGLPVQADSTETKTSGIVVPRERIVAPMTISESAVRRAKETTPATIRPAPLVRMTMHTANVGRMAQVARPVTEVR